MPGRAGLHTEVVIEAALVPGGVLESATWVAGSLLGRRREPLPVQVTSVWAALRLPAVVAGERMAQAGRALAGVLLAEADQQLLAGLLDRLAPGDTAEVVLSVSGDALSLPAELIRLRTGAGGEVPPAGADARGERVAPPGGTRP